MTIKEVEKAVGITSANIRYYEKEQMITPIRNVSNNYREYSEENILTLKKIKFLRTLGISIADIKLLMKNPQKLADVIERQIVQIRAESAQLQKSEEVCVFILKEHLSLDALSDAILDEKSELLKDKLARILKSDTTKDTMGKKQLNSAMGIMLFYAFGVNAIIAWCVGDYFLGNVQSWTIWLYVLLSLAAGLMIGMTANPLVLFMMFQGVTLLLMPTLLTVVSLIFKGVSVVYIELFFCIVTAYIVFLWVLSRCSKRAFEKVYYVVIPASLFTVMGTVLYYVLYGKVLIPALCLACVMLYISVRWSLTNTNVEEYSKYYVIVSVIQMINIVPMLLGAGGAGANWRRGGKTYE